MELYISNTLINDTENHILCYAEQVQDAVNWTEYPEISKGWTATDMENNTYQDKLNKIVLRYANDAPKTIENPEYLQVILDSNNRVLEGTKKDGTKYFPGKVDVQGCVTESIDSPEWAKVYTDSNGKVIGGIKVDGSVEWYKGIPTPILQYINNKINELKEYIDSNE